MDNYFRFDKLILADQYNRNTHENLFEESSVPFVVQPGFRVPEQFDPNGRFLIAFGTTTKISTTTSTYSYVLTATCKLFFHSNLISKRSKWTFLFLFQRQKYDRFPKLWNTFIVIVWKRWRRSIRRISLFIFSMA